MEYPECEKMKAVNNESQKIGEFIDWLQTKKEVTFIKYVENHAVFIYNSTEELLAEFFNIDLKKVEEEKRHMLKALQQ